jgi:hypothetical protein
MAQFVEAYVFPLRAVLHGVKILLIQNLDLAVAIAAAAIALLFISWLGGLRKRALAHRESQHNEVVAYHLNRVATALERLSRPQRAEMEFRSSRDSRTELTEENSARQPGVGSVFGFGLREPLRNPLYRPK